MGAGSGGEGSVLDRARRLLVPGYLPVLRLRWFSLALVLAFCGLTLTGFLGRHARAGRDRARSTACGPADARLPAEHLSGRSRRAYGRRRTAPQAGNDGVRG